MSSKPEVVFSNEVNIPCDLVLVTVHTTSGLKIPLKLRFEKSLGIGKLINEHPNEIARIINLTFFATLNSIQKPLIPSGTVIHKIVDEIPAAVLKEEPKGELN